MCAIAANYRAAAAAGAGLTAEEPSDLESGTWNLETGQRSGRTAGNQATPCESWH